MVACMGLLVLTAFLISCRFSLVCASFDDIFADFDPIFYDVDTEETLTSINTQCPSTFPSGENVMSAQPNKSYMANQGNVVGNYYGNNQGGKIYRINSSVPTPQRGCCIEFGELRGLMTSLQTVCSLFAMQFPNDKSADSWRRCSEYSLYNMSLDGLSEAEIVNNNLAMVVQLCRLMNITVPDAKSNFMLYLNAGFKYFCGSVLARLSTPTLSKELIQTPETSLPLQQDQSRKRKRVESTLDSSTESNHPQKTQKASAHDCSVKLFKTKIAYHLLKDLYLAIKGLAKHEPVTIDGIFDLMQELAQQALKVENPQIVDERFRISEVRLQYLADSNLLPIWTEGREHNDLLDYFAHNMDLIKYNVLDQLIGWVYSLAYMIPEQRDKLAMFKFNPSDVSLENTETKRRVKLTSKTSNSKTKSRYTSGMNTLSFVHWCIVGTALRGNAKEFKKLLLKGFSTLKRLAKEALKKHQTEDEIDKELKKFSKVYSLSAKLLKDIVKDDDDDIDKALEKYTSLLSVTTKTQARKALPYYLWTVASLVPNLIKFPDLLLYDYEVQKFYELSKAGSLENLKIA